MGEPVTPLLLVVSLGLADPFAPPPAEAQRENEVGFALLRQHDSNGAAPHFRKALARFEEYDAARYNLATCAALRARWGEALAEVDTLLLHNYPRYARRLLSDPDWAPLRVAKERELLRQKLDEARVAYRAGLDRALLFVGRLRPAVESAIGESVRLFLHQELFAFDPGSGRYRQLTDTDGRVVAFVRGPGGRRVGYVSYDRVRRQNGFEIPEEGGAFELSLDTLDPGDPRPLPAAALFVLGFSAGGFQVLPAERIAGVRLLGQGVRVARDTIGPALDRSPRIALSERRFAVPSCTKGIPEITVRDRKGSAPIRIATRHGASLFGLPVSGGCSR